MVLLGWFYAPGTTCSHSSVFHTSGGGSGLPAFPWQDFRGGFYQTKHRSVLTLVCLQHSFAPIWKSLAGSAITFPIPKLVGGLGEQKEPRPPVRKG